VPRILICGINYAPELTGIGKYTGEMAAWLAGHGWDVRVVTTPPYYPDWAVQAPYRWWQYKRETIAGVTVIRCPVWVPRRPTGVTRIVHLVSFALSSLPVCLANILWRPHVIFAVEPPLLGAMVAALTGLVGRSKLWLHVQDFELDAAKGLGLVRAHGLMRVAERFEKWLMCRFDRVSSISGAMVKRLAYKGVQVEKTRLLPNWVDCGKVFPLGKEQSLRAEWGIPASTKVVLYAGNIGKKQGLDILLDVAQKFRKDEPKIIFVIVGEGAAKEKLERSAADRQLTNVMFFPLQPADKLAAMLATADVHLVLQRRGASDLVMPSKLTGILAAGGAALITADEGTELYRLVEQDDVGLAVAPESAQALAEGLLVLFSQPQLLEALRSNARKYAQERLEKSVVLVRLEQEISRLVAAPGEA
jgi:colanic acid biosynthesis glycosyl transferase WcaI